ncbi:threonine/serine exporter family protein [Acidaminobacter sp. JC074]|uniref:threonine/serine ThrE exporter family protein n=1 Tax=Acidaminobacter sp. JC074 TaxID=2530199 RepID=UPI001F0D8371|nr:threonine/serine exporter family protein [Acidaminobacter sp. JC074]MCH4888278.1 threonine/serine exporter family protein [Acidaminobacter sp. JC074]
MEKNQVKEILEVSIAAGKIMLEHGAETMRVENTIQRICCSRGLDVEIFTIPTGIFLSCDYNGELYSYVKRTKSHTIDLEIISKINSFSRSFVNSDMTIEEANQALKDILNTPHFKPIIVSLFGGLAGGFFTLTFGGNMLEAFSAFVTSFTVVSVVRFLGRYIGSFVRNAIGGMVNTLVAFILILSFHNIGIQLELSNIVIGSLMPLVPGVAITNAFRDSITGDFVSGVSKLTEAVLAAIAIALGVGVVLHIKVIVTGSVI